MYPGLRVRYPVIYQLDTMFGLNFEFECVKIQNNSCFGSIFDFTGERYSVTRRVRMKLKFKYIA